MKIQPERFRIQDYLGQEFSCSCGRRHSAVIREILVEPGAVCRVPELMQHYGHHHPLLVCDERTWEAAGEQLSGILSEAGFPLRVHCIASEEPVPDETALGALMMEITPETDLLLAVGTGTLNDLTKYASFMRGIPYFIVGTAPSMDGFASTGAPLIWRNLKTTFPAHAPEAIIGDVDILRTAPMELINAGLGDILGKYSCLMDWKLAHIVNGEYYCPVITAMVEKSIEEVRRNSARIGERNPEAVASVMNALILTGIAMSFVGNSRPASGCEHHLSHYWEMMYLMQGRRQVLHGRKVAVATSLTTDMYHRLAERRIDFQAARERIRDFDAARWRQEMHAVYGKAAGGIIALEEQSHKNDPAEVLRRIDAIEAHWDEIQSVIRKSVPGSEAIIEILRELGAPVLPAEVGVDRELARRGILWAKEVRDRYTLLQLLFDLGIAEEFAEESCRKFYGETAES